MLAARAADTVRYGVEHGDIERGMAALARTTILRRFLHQPCRYTAVWSLQQMTKNADALG
jgi:hypothetical protein